MNTKRHDETVIAMLQADPDFAQTYLQVAFEEIDLDGGETAFLLALRHIVEARGGVASIAQKSGLSRVSLYRALSSKGNPTLRTMRQVIHATGLKFSAP